jgi:Cytochrome c, mono- and diheme variants
VPRNRPQPEPFEPEWLERSLDRYLALGVIFMVLLMAGFMTYRLREPTLRHAALTEQTASYKKIGHGLFVSNCASCHGKLAQGGSGPTLNAKEFLGATTDAQIHVLVAGGVSGSDMPSWGIDFGGTMTDEQVQQIVTYLRSLQPTAPSVPDWRKGKTAAG